MNSIRKLFPLMLVALAIIFFDQVTKMWIDSSIEPHSHGFTVIENYFNIRHDRNSGAAFSLMSGQKTFLIVATLVAICFIFYYYFQFGESLWMRLSLGFLLGGAIGNFIDRVRYGEVIDFLQIGILPDYVWPTFNVADVSVCVGAGMLIIYSIRHREENKIEIEN